MLIFFPSPPCPPFLKPPSPSWGTWKLCFLEETPPQGAPRGVARGLEGVTVFAWNRYNVANWPSHRETVHFFGVQRFGTTKIRRDFWGLCQARKRHININFLVRLLLGHPGNVPGTNRVCPRDKVGLSQGQTQVFSLLYTVEAQFVPGTNPVCPSDIPGTKGGRKSLCVKSLCAFFVPYFGHKMSHSFYLSWCLQKVASIGIYSVSRAFEWIQLETQEATQNGQNVHGFRVRTPICHIVPVSRAYRGSPHRLKEGISLKNCARNWSVENSGTF